MFLVKDPPAGVWEFQVMGCNAIAKRICIDLSQVELKSTWVLNWHSVKGTRYSSQTFFLPEPGPGDYEFQGLGISLWSVFNDVNKILTKVSKYLFGQMIENTFENQFWRKTAQYDIAG